MSTTTTTRFLIISDTHDLQIADIEKCSGEFTQPLPDADVILHCGDLTMSGGLNAYKSFLRLMGSMTAELKLVIAGNHDRDLDSNWLQARYSADAAEDMHTKAKELMTGPMAKHAGVTIYTSPYQPEFCGWAFPYERYEDRFNPPEHVAKGGKSIVENPIPDFPNVDIIMTHGPPKRILDWVRGSEERVGCDALLRAASRARPRLYCFGHIHEGHGCNVVKWKDDKDVIGQEAVEEVVDVKKAYPKAIKRKTEFGKETMMVNAAIMDVEYSPKNAGWLVDLELPKAE